MGFGSICELLVQANLLAPNHLSPIMAECAKKHITVGQYLYTSGAMDLNLVRGAVMCQLLIRDNLLPKEVAVHALQVTAQSQVSIEEALEQAGWNVYYFEHINLMSKLLRKANCVSKLELANAFEICFEKRIPILQILCERKLLTYELCNDILVVEKLLLNDLVSFDAALAVLKTLHTQNMPLQDALKEHCSTLCTIDRAMFLGELLMAAGVITAQDFIKSVERGIFEKTKLGEVFVVNGVVDADVIIAALDYQKLIAAGKYTTTEAVQRLKKVLQKQSK